MKHLKDFINESQGIDTKKLASKYKVDINIIEPLKHGIEYGYIKQMEDNDKIVTYGISRENIIQVYTSENAIDKETLEKIIKEIENSGIKFKFEKDSEWQKKGYEDPINDKK